MFLNFCLVPQHTAELINRLTEIFEKEVKKTPPVLDQVYLPILSHTKERARHEGSLSSLFPLLYQTTDFSRIRAIALPRREKQDAAPSTDRHAPAGKPTAKASPHRHSARQIACRSEVRPCSIQAAKKWQAGP